VVAYVTKKNNNLAKYGELYMSVTYHTRRTFDNKIITRFGTE